MNIRNSRTCECIRSMSIPDFQMCRESKIACDVGKRRFGTEKIERKKREKNHICYVRADSQQATKIISVCERCGLNSLALSLSLWTPKRWRKINGKVEQRKGKKASARSGFERACCEHAKGRVSWLQMSGIALCASRARIGKIDRDSVRYTDVLLLCSRKNTSCKNHCDRQRDINDECTKHVIWAQTHVKNDILTESLCSSSRSAHQTRKK